MSIKERWVKCSAEMMLCLSALRIIVGLISYGNGSLVMSATCYTLNHNGVQSQWWVHPTPLANPPCPLQNYAWFSEVNSRRFVFSFLMYICMKTIIYESTTHQDLWSQHTISYGWPYAVWKHTVTNHSCQPKGLEQSIHMNALTEDVHLETQQFMSRATLIGMT